MMINGTGKKFFGRDEVMKDGSYIATEWECLLWIPLIPVASYRIFDERKESTLLGIKTVYQLKEIPLYQKQIKEMRRTLLIGVLTVIGLGVLLFFAAKLQDSLK